MCKNRKMKTRKQPDFIAQLFNDMKRVMLGTLLIGVIIGASVVIGVLYL